ncbi:MAG: hypothetical protein ACI9QQ_000300 [Myxococcota bacterium]|jgi:hypothetical protein
MSTTGQQTPAAATASLSPLDGLMVGASVLAVAFVGWVLLPRGINMSDEGYLLQQCVDMLAGKVLYRDIESFIAPGIWFLITGLFSIVEPSVLASRSVAAVSFFAIPVLVFQIVRTRCGVRFAAGAAGCYAILGVWAFPHWTWAWYSPYAILLALLAMHSVLAWGERGNATLLIRAGVYVGLVATFKQNYGFLALVGCLVGVVGVSIDAFRRSEESLAASSARAEFVRNVVRMGAGVLLGITPLILFLGYYGVLFGIQDRFVVYPLEFRTEAYIPFLNFEALFNQSVFIDRVTSTNYIAELALKSPANLPLSPGIGVVRFLHALLYWLPPFLISLGYVLSFRPLATTDNSQGGRGLDVPMFVVTGMSSLMFLGIFPRADFTHLITVYQPLLVLGAFVAHRVARGLAVRPSFVRWSSAALVGAVIALLGLSASAWLKDMTETMTVKLPQPRGGVMVHGINAVGINQLVKVVQANTEEGEPFFGLPDMATLNFLAERDVPGSQYQTYAHMIARDRGALTTEQLAAANVNFIIARYDNVLSTNPRLSSYAPTLADYLETNFEYSWLIQNGQYILMNRVASPKAPLETVDALLDCVFAGGNAAESSVRQHMFFASLFQPLVPDEIEQHGETRCRVTVPPGKSELTFRLGYRHPAVAGRKASLTAEVFARVESTDELAADEPGAKLFEQSLRVLPANVNGEAFAATSRVDLAQFANRNIVLTFKTSRRGRVKLSPYTLETYALSWQNPVIEHAVAQ